MFLARGNYLRHAHAVNVISTDICLPSSSRRSPNSTNIDEACPSRISHVRGKLLLRFSLTTIIPLVVIRRAAVEERQKQSEKRQTANYYKSRRVFLRRLIDATRYDCNVEHCLANIRVVRRTILLCRLENMLTGRNMRERIILSLSHVYFAR